MPIVVQNGRISGSISSEESIMKASFGIYFMDEWSLLIESNSELPTAQRKKSTKKGVFILLRYRYTSFMELQKSYPLSLEEGHLLSCNHERL